MEKREAPHRYLYLSTDPQCESHLLSTHDYVYSDVNSVNWRSLIVLDQQNNERILSLPLHTTEAPCDYFNPFSYYCYLTLTLNKGK
ncbi:hypothetical protein ACFP7A_14025 [Sporolactobacillus kofuensis]|uniref:Uncharacterized protein n=1 Tax=Sporolactobacillus kofuensis TaxID=269672 RepID=A0ABW1WH49_9BACL|nr:hypothetical protein [Sporolactobacillus kofuensis]MCO7177169.1 hypothetical protein [Sporolactobacillus kofuensis]